MKCLAKTYLTCAPEMTFDCRDRNKRACVEISDSLPIHRCRISVSFEDTILETVQISPAVSQLSINAV